MQRIRVPGRAREHRRQKRTVERARQRAPGFTGGEKLSIARIGTQHARGGAEVWGEHGRPRDRLGRA